MAEHTATSDVTAGAVSVTPAADGYSEIQYQNLSHYTKFIPALVAAAGTTFVQVNGHGNWLFILLSIVIAVAQAFCTYQFDAGDRVLNSAKFWVNVVAVIAQGIVAIVGAGGNIADVTSTQWVAIGLSALSALGVAVLPNGPKISQQIVADPDAKGVYNVTNLTNFTSPDTYATPSEILSAFSGTPVDTSALVEPHTEADVIAAAQDPSQDGRDLS